MLAGLNTNKINKKDNSSDLEKSSVEILKEEQECPNCHFARLKKVDGEVICQICGYGHKRCGG